MVSCIKMNWFVCEHVYAIGFRLTLFAKGLLGLDGLQIVYQVQIVYVWFTRFTQDDFLVIVDRDESIIIN